jgi:hypothetical protein
LRLNEIALAMVVVVGTGTVACAEGFKTHDLTTVENVVLDQFEEADYHWSTASDMSIVCCGHDEDLILNVSLDRQTDETGQENRTDEAYIDELEHSCTIIGCQIEKIDVGPTPMIIRLLRIPNLGGGYKGVNVFVVKDGDRLSIKSAAKTMEKARENAEKTLEVLKEPVIGE